MRHSLHLILVLACGGTCCAALLCIIFLTVFVQLFCVVHWRTCILDSDPVTLLTIFTMVTHLQHAQRWVYSLLLCSLMYQGNDYPAVSQNTLPSTGSFPSDGCTIHCAALRSVAHALLLLCFCSAVIVSGSLAISPGVQYLLLRYTSCMLLGVVDLC